ncbi:unnamed protein product [Symbiodinium sp. CCMP2456]|nr:unnamed protein product [Symbiodinium sp. CCMP2456]
MSCLALRMFAAAIGWALRPVSVAAEPARDIWSLTLTGYECHGDTATVLVEQMGYGELWSGCSGCTDYFHSKHDRDSIKDGRVIVGWLHKFTLRPTGASRGQRNYKIGVGALGERNRKFWVGKTFDCLVQEEL